MQNGSCSAANWFLAGLVLLSGMAGVALHSIPGNGHLIQLPVGCLGVGVLLDLDRSGNPQTAIQNGRGCPYPCEDADECPICRFSGQSQLSEGGHNGLELARLVENLPSAVLPDRPGAVLFAFEPRPPPAA